MNVKYMALLLVVPVAHAQSVRCRTDIPNEVICTPQPGIQATQVDTSPIASIARSQLNVPQAIANAYAIYNAQRQAQQSVHEEPDEAQTQRKSQREAEAAARRAREDEEDKAALEAYKKEIAAMVAEQKRAQRLSDIEAGRVSPDEELTDQILEEVRK